jgi:hypothetical protein
LQRGDFVMDARPLGLARVGTGDNFVAVTSVGSAYVFGAAGGMAGSLRDTAQHASLPKASTDA